MCVAEVARVACVATHNESWLLCVGLVVLNWGSVRYWTDVVGDVYKSRQAVKIWNNQLSGLVIIAAHLVHQSTVAKKKCRLLPLVLTMEGRSVTSSKNIYVVWFLATSLLWEQLDACWKKRRYVKCLIFMFFKVFNLYARDSGTRMKKYTIEIKKYDVLWSRFQCLPLVYICTFGEIKWLIIID